VELGKPLLRETSSPGPVVDIHQIFANVKQVLVRRTYLSETDSSIVAYWVIWFLEALWVNPCLVITGPAHEATMLLRILENLCGWPFLVAGVQQSFQDAVDLGAQSR
jgi:hypothetical protein